MKIKIKDQLPDTEIFQLIDGEPQKSNLREIIGNGKIVLFGLPGAFTSTCSKLHLPGFVANADKIKAKGMGIRSNRYLMVIENFTVVNIHVEKETKECGLTSAENLLNNLL